MSPNIRAYHGVFAAFAVLNLAFLATGSGLVVLRTLALAGYGVATVLSIVAALRPDGTRRTMIVAQLALAPLQFVFSIPSTLALAGIPLSILVLTRLKPRYPLLRPRSRRIWLLLHVGFSVGWLGVSTAMTALAVTGALADSPSLRHGCFEALGILDYEAAIPSMALALVTGLVVSLGTKWGFARHWWVLVKFFVAISIPIVAGSVESALADDLTSRTLDPAYEPGGSALALVVCLGGFAALLWFATILSIVKPWGRTRWGRRADAEQRAARRTVPTAA